MAVGLRPSDIEQETGLTIYPRSLSAVGDDSLFMAKAHEGKRLCLLAGSESRLLSRFSGERADRDRKVLMVCPLSHANALALRGSLAWLAPQPLGLRTSAGCGDRLGLATPGHVRAARNVGGDIAMIFAQQSIREMTRTGRSPDDVMDDATWGIFQEGWQEGVGADADHLKTTADIDRCVAADFTFYTIDPGDHVDGEADTDQPAALRAKFEALPWAEMETTPRLMRAAYVGKRFEIADRALSLDEEALLRAAAKYSRAVAHTAKMFRHLVEAMGDRPFELEVSVDETATPTTHAEHLFVASELQRLGVRWVSLAPRYVGRFEKGVDYIPSVGLCGDLGEFEASFAGHATIARALGPYKLSLHSGSDKFSIYEIASAQTGGLLHLKTAGTSYLEALRATAGFDPPFFREILSFAVGRYETDRASYHVSAELRNVPDARLLRDGELPLLLDQFDARQVLHVTFGSVLTSDRGYKQRLMAGLAGHEEQHFEAVERHFVRHLRPLVAGKQAS